MTELPAPVTPVVSTPSSPTEYTPQWTDWTRRAVTIGLVIATVYALTLLAPVIQVLVTAFLVAFLMYIPARFLAKHTRLNFGGSVGIVYFILIMLLMLFIVTFVPGFVNAVNSFARNLEDGYSNAREYILNYEMGTDTFSIAGLSIALDPLIEPLKELINQFDPEVESPTPIFNLGSLGQNSGLNIQSAAPALQTVTTLLTGAVSSIGNISSSAILAIFLSFLILIEMPKYQHTLMDWIPRPYHRETLLLLDKIFELWTGFFRGQLIIAIVIGVLTWLQLTLMGIPQANVLAVFTAFISLIPTIGGFIALIPLGLVPLLQGSTTLEFSNVAVAGLVVGGNLVLSQVIWNGVAPSILGTVVALPVPVIIVGVVIGAAVGGILGAFLIVPLLGTTRLLVLYLLAKINQRDPFPGENLPMIQDLAAL